ncbi:hypothetical protein Hanom_Chr09g00860401 [Helianthus anomalus]
MYPIKLECDSKSTRCRGRPSPGSSKPGVVPHTIPTVAKFEPNDGGVENVYTKKIYRTGGSKTYIPKKFYTKTTYITLLSEKFGGSSAPLRPFYTSPLHSGWLVGVLNVGVWTMRTRGKGQNLLHLFLTNTYTYNIYIYNLGPSPISPISPRAQFFLTFSETALLRSILFVPSSHSSYVTLTWRPILHQ